MKMTLPLLALLFLASTGLWAFEGPSPALGKILFESPELGKHQKSCASCHPNGKGIHPNSRQQILDATNACLTDRLQATALAADSQEFESLLLHIESLARGE